MKALVLVLAPGAQVGVVAMNAGKFVSAVTAGVGEPTRQSTRAICWAEGLRVTQLCFTTHGDSGRLLDSSPTDA